jgi:transposase-like protein
MKRRYSNEQKAELVEKYRKTGKSKAGFAAGEGIKIQTFYNWLKKAGPSGGNSSRFVELKVPSYSAGQEKITVRKNGLEVMVYNIESFEKVMKVMAVL